MRIKQRPRIKKQQQQKRNNKIKWRKQCKREDTCNRGPNKMYTDQEKKANEQEAKATDWFVRVLLFLVHFTGESKIKEEVRILWFRFCNWFSSVSPAFWPFRKAFGHRARHTATWMQAKCLPLLRWTLIVWTIDVPSFQVYFRSINRHDEFSFVAWGFRLFKV